MSAFDLSPVSPPGTQGSYVREKKKRSQRSGVLEIRVQGETERSSLFQ